MNLKEYEDQELNSTNLNKVIDIRKKQLLYKCSVINVKTIKDLDILKEIVDNLILLGQAIKLNNKLKEFNKLFQIYYDLYDNPYYKYINNVSKLYLEKYKPESLNIKFFHYNEEKKSINNWIEKYLVKPNHEVNLKMDDYFNKFNDVKDENNLTECERNEFYKNNTFSFLVNLYSYQKDFKSLKNTQKYLNCFDNSNPIRLLSLMLINVELFFLNPKKMLKDKSNLNLIKEIYFAEINQNNIVISKNLFLSYFTLLILISYDKSVNIEDSYSFIEKFKSLELENNQIENIFNLGDYDQDINFLLLITKLLKYRIRISQTKEQIKFFKKLLEKHIIIESSITLKF